MRLRLGTVLVALAACYVLAATALVVDGLNDEVFAADLIVVLGNTVQPDGQPSPRLRARLDAAWDVHLRYPRAMIMVSGGTGKEGFDESQVMAAYLIQRGVPATLIVQDGQSLDTAATARNASAYMQGHGSRSAIVVSQYFHLSRTKLALRRAGVSRLGSAHALFVEWRDLYSIFREVPAYAAYALRR